MNTIRLGARMPVIPAHKAVLRKQTLGSPALLTNEFTLNDAIIPKDIQGGLFLGASGAAVIGLSEILPADIIQDDMRPIGIIGGLAIAGFGAYKLYDYFFGSQTIKSITVPPQKKSNLEMVNGRILEPAPGGQAKLSNMWPAASGLENNRSFRIVFQITNNSPEDLILPIEVNVSEAKTLLPNATTRTNYVVKVKGRGSSEIVSEWQPISAILIGGINATAQLILKGSSELHDRPLGAPVTFGI